jgi:thioredoxin reductase
MTTSPSEPVPQQLSADHSPFDPAAPVALAVIGAGPAGLAAAVTAAEHGTSVVLLDAESVVGGQFWRHPAGGGKPGAITDHEVADLHHDLSTYRTLRSRLAAAVASGRIVHLSGHEVWSVERGPEAGAGGGGLFRINAVDRSDVRPRSVSVWSRCLLIATGAFDLQVPFPGWDLPGVMTAGGVQSLLKGHGVLAGRRVVVAGSGPFLLSVASGLARRGATVLGVYEAARPSRWISDLRSVVGATGKLREGVGYAAGLTRHRIPYRTGWTVVAAHGHADLESVLVAPTDSAGHVRPARSRRISADVLAVGWGFVPQIDLAMQLGCAVEVGTDGLPVVTTDIAGRTSVRGVWAAGEVRGVGGAELALVEGELAGTALAMAVARETHGPKPPNADDPTSRVGRRTIRKMLLRRAALLRFASALQRTYPVPRSWIDAVTDDTVVCRCEEVSAGAIRAVVERDLITDGRTAKLLVRPGMGWCQGRICGYATERLVREWGRSQPADSADGDSAVERPVVIPVPLALLAGEADGAPTDRAVDPP